MFASAMLSVVLAAPVPKEADEKFEKGVAAARQKAIDFLKKQQTAKGNWEDGLNLLADMEGGATALAALSLLEAGVPADDAAVVKAVEYLVKLPPKKTYVVSLQTQVLARADAKAHAKQIQANADWLLKEAIRGGGRLTGWSYPGNEIADGSNAHYAVFGLHAAAQAGAKVDEKIWGEVRDLYARTRLDGGWSYYTSRFGDTRPTPSMTGAALVSLTIAGKYDKAAKNPDPAFEKGMAAYVSMPVENAKSTMYNLMVGAELGRLLGVMEFKAGDKTRAWYRDWAEKLVKEQKEDGSWNLGKGIDGQPVLAAAFGLYFLGPPPKK